MGHHLHLVQGFAAGLRIPQVEDPALQPELAAERVQGGRVASAEERRQALALRLFSDQPAGVAVGAIDHPVTGHGASPSVQVAFRLDLVARSAASVAQRKSCRRPARSLFWHAVPVVARLRVARVAAQEEQREKRNADSGNGGDGLHRRAFRSLRPGQGLSVRVSGRRADAVEHLVARGAEFVPGDLADPALVLRLCEDVEAVVHCAGAVGVWGPRERFLAANVGLAESVVEACMRQKVRRLVHLSSPSIYFDGRDHRT